VAKASPGVFILPHACTSAAENAPAPELVPAGKAGQNICRKQILDQDQKSAVQALIMPVSYSIGRQ
jgi:hypothetical protein